MPFCTHLTLILNLLKFVFVNHTKMAKIPFDSVICKEKNPALKLSTDSFLLGGGRSCKY